MNDYQLAELSPEEAKALTDEMQAVLAKYNAEMSVTSNLIILKRAPLPEQEKKDGN